MQIIGFPKAAICFTNEQYKMIDYVITNYDKFEFLRKKLQTIRDIEHLYRKIIFNKISPFDLYSFNKNLTTISIQGMTCGHCTNSVKQTIESVGGKKVEVNLDQSNAYFDCDVNIIELKEKIESLGYKVES